VLTQGAECLNGTRLEGLRGRKNQMNHGWVPWVVRRASGLVSA
jgi:hypothetical protein